MKKPEGPYPYPELISVAASLKATQRRVLELRVLAESFLERLDDTEAALLCDDVLDAVLWNLTVRLRVYEGRR